MTDKLVNSNVDNNYTATGGLPLTKTQSSFFTFLFCFFFKFFLLLTIDFCDRITHEIHTVAALAYACLGQCGADLKGVGLPCMHRTVSH